MVEHRNTAGRLMVYLDTGFGAGAYVGLPCTESEALAAIADSVLEVHR